MTSITRTIGYEQLHLSRDPVTYIELAVVDLFDVINPHSHAWAITLKALQKLERTS